ncbi:acid protease, partial [Lichtheimia hyalospora FSU 10163]
QFVSLPFVAVDRKGVHTSAWDQRLDETGVNVPLQNMDLAYLMNISIGTPPQPFTLLLDTGSSTTWVPIEGCGRFCGYPIHTLVPQESSTFNTDNMLFSIRYGEGFSSGYYAEDTVTLNDVISVPHTNFAVSNINDGELTRDGADGILGIGPDPLSRFNNPDNAVVPTLVSTMFEQGVISSNLFSIYFQPINGTSLESRINGNIIFGG